MSNTQANARLTRGRQRSPSASGTSKQFWAAIIDAVSSYPRLLALVVLVAEGMLAIAMLGDRQHAMTYAFLMGGIVLLVIACATVVAFKKPDLLGPGVPTRLPLPETEKERLIEENKAKVLQGNVEPLSQGELTREMQQLRLVLYQAPRYSTPTYYLDKSLSVIHWNIGFELIFQPILHKIRRRHVNYFIAELSNPKDVFVHAQEFTEKVKQNRELPAVDLEPLAFSSSTYGSVEMEKVAAQLTDDEANLKAWSVALLIKNIDWDRYVYDLDRRTKEDKLWNMYAVPYDSVLADFSLYRQLLEEVVGYVPRGARRVLELGAGTGNVTRILLQKGYEVTAVENNPGMLEKMSAKKLGITGRLNLIFDSVETMDLTEERSFDAAVSVNVIYALDDPLGCFKKVGQVLRQGATFSFSTTHSGTDLDALLDAIERELREKGTFREKEQHYRQVVSINRNIEQTTAKRYSKEQYLAWPQQAGFEVVQARSSYKGAVIVVQAVKV